MEYYNGTRDSKKFENLIKGIGVFVLTNDQFIDTINILPLQ